MSISHKPGIHFRTRQSICLINHQNERDTLFLQHNHPLTFQLRQVASTNKQDDVRPLYGFQGAGNALSAQLRIIVIEARSVYQQTCTERMDFHRLTDGVGGGARYYGYDGSILPGQGIDQGGLAHVAPS